MGSVGRVQREHGHVLIGRVSFFSQARGALPLPGRVGAQQQQHMDNTKLHTVDAVGDHTIGAVRILTDQGIQIAGCHVPNTERNNQEDAAELVRRWNAYERLVDEVRMSIKADTSHHSDLAAKGARRLLDELGEQY